MKTRRWYPLRWPLWRIVRLPLAAVLLVACGYLLWSPGERVLDGRHDRGTNGLWLQHGWLGDDGWFARTAQNPAAFRSEEALRGLATRLQENGIRYVFPHLCPCTDTGELPPVDAAQTQRLLAHLPDVSVIPWIGGVYGEHCLLESIPWRRKFVASAVTLLTDHPGLAGVQVNVEPLPSGNASWLRLLDELRGALPAGKILSVAAYPPPTRWQPAAEVHWDEAYFREVARRCDQLAPMLYDTGIPLARCYESLIAAWTQDVLTWSGDTQVLLGLPAYDDAGTGYHSPRVENLTTGLRGAHAGLSKLPALPAHYAGVAIYCDWEMDEAEWTLFRQAFRKRP